MIWSVVNSPHQWLDSKHCFWPSICDALSPVFLGQHLSPVTSSALKLEYSRCFQSDIPISMRFANITWILHCSLLIIVFFIQGNPKRFSMNHVSIMPCSWNIRRCFTSAAGSWGKTVCKIPLGQEGSQKLEKFHGDTTSNDGNQIMSYNFILFYRDLGEWQNKQWWAVWTHKSGHSQYGDMCIYIDMMYLSVCFFCG